MMPVAAAKLATFAVIALLNVAIRTPVVDQAAALSQLEQDTIELRVRALRQHTGVQLAVLTILSTAGEPIADFSHRTAAAWGGGRKGYDDGLLLTIAVADRRSRLEVGYGLESKLPDGVVREILENSRAELQRRQYGAAIGKILDQLDLRLATGSGAASSLVASTSISTSISTSAGAESAGGVGSAPTALSTELPEIPLPVRAEPSPPPLPLSPLGMLALVPLFGVVLGYALGAWRCSEGTRAVDVFAYLTLGAAAFFALLFGVQNPHGYYLAIALGTIGWVNMFARITGLTVAGHLVAVVLAVVPALLTLILQVSIGDPSRWTDASWQSYLLFAELVGAATLFLIAIGITRYFSHTWLWDSSRTRAAGQSSGSGGPYGGPYDDSGTWGVRRDSRDSDRGGGGGGGGDWGGSGGDWGGGGADMSF